MDRRTPYSLSVLAPSVDGAEDSRTQIQARLREFVLEFQLDNAFIYRYAMTYDMDQWIYVRERGGDWANRVV